ncbi:MAG: hypothetical protein BKP49_01095 [Treponema sp. CETP13]|nr:MAG: hypothetical protein BKP49_01095 [Treponema sp. CETP13]
MSRKRSILCFFLLILIFPLFAQVDFISGNIRIVVDDFNGSISVFRKINPIEEQKDNKTEKKIDRYTGASGTKFGALPDSAYVLQNTDKKENTTQDTWLNLLDTGRYTSNSAYYLSYNSGIFKLGHSAFISINSNVEEETNDVIVSYTLKKKAVVIIRLHVFASQLNVEADSIRVSITTKNLTDERIRIAVKAVFDTYLGENGDSHFITANSDEINSEISYDTMTQAKWICSQNEKAGIRFLLNGRTITSPEYVILANKEVASSQKWVPTTKTGRRFDSLFSYNNSALCIVWKRVYLKKGKSSTNQFYITTAEKGEDPSELFTNMNTSQVEFNANSGSIEDKIVPPKKPDVVDAAYVQRLLNYIALLKSNPGIADEKEIEYLTVEVENILKQMGQ